MSIARRLFNWRLIFVVSTVILFSCEDENPEPGIPVFVQVDKFDFNSDYGVEGTGFQKITDVWVFADGATIGVFELPATIPVLKKGSGELRLEAGILINGISTTRINNPFFEPVIIGDFLFQPDSIIHIEPETFYRSSVVFDWIEDFETPSFSLDTSNLGGTAGIARVSGAEAFEGIYSALVVLNQEQNTFEAATFEAFDLPVSGQPVLLELHYKNTHKFSVGIIEQNISQIIKSEILILNPSEEWNKIYINYTDKVRSASSSSEFKILIRSYIEDEAEAKIYLDNIKLLHR
jgi:hypothetical protein